MPLGWKCCHVFKAYTNIKQCSKTESTRHAVDASIDRMMQWDEGMHLNTHLEAAAGQTRAREFGKKLASVGIFPEKPLQPN
eukprot:1081402-Pelagomonas_calceolata.AAC.2